MSVHDVHARHITFREHGTRMHSYWITLNDLTRRTTNMSPVICEFLVYSINILYIYISSNSRLFMCDFKCISVKSESI